MPTNESLTVAHKLQCFICKVTVENGRKFEGIKLRIIGSHWTLLMYFIYCVMNVVGYFITEQIGGMLTVYHVTIQKV